MILTCKKYQFDLPPEPNERNYFSLEDKTLIDTIDLADYLIKGGLGKISYQSSKIDEENTQFIEAGSVDIQLLNIAKGWSNTINYSNIAFTLSDWFELNNFVDQFVFLLEIRQTESGELIWSGVIRKEGISFPQRNNEEMNISAISLDKEFAEYFSNKPLVSFDEFPEVNMTFNLASLDFTTLDWVLLKNFPNVNFEFESFIYDYRVANRGYLYAPLPDILILTNTLSLMAGYEQFYLDNLDRYTYFNSIMLGMGWRWFFKGDTMYIRERYDETVTTTTLDYSEDFIGHGLSLKVDTARKQVAVYAGQISGIREEIIDRVSHAVNLQMIPSPFNVAAYYYLGGHSWKIFQVDYSGGNYNLPYENLVYVGQGVYNRQYQRGAITVADLAQEKGGQAKKLTMKKIGQVEPQWNALDNIETFSYQDAETVLLRPYCVSDSNSFLLDLTQARTSNDTFYGNGNAYKGAHDPGTNGIFVKGTPATGLLKFDDETLEYSDYNYYVRTPAFSNNMKTYTGGSDKLIMNCVVNGIYNNPGERFQISNYPYSPIAGINFIAENVEIDLINNVTTLTLKSV